MGLYLKPWYRPTLEATARALQPIVMCRCFHLGDTDQCENCLEIAKVALEAAIKELGGPGAS